MWSYIVVGYLIFCYLGILIIAGMAWSYDDGKKKDSPSIDNLLFAFILSPILMPVFIGLMIGWFIQKNEKSKTNKGRKHK